MKKLLIVVMACYGLTARSQVDESKNFIYFYSDSLMYAQSVKLRPDFFGSLQLRADSRRISLDKVKFFNNTEGFFANTRRLTFSPVSEFSERIIEGRINLFQQIAYDPLRYERGYRHRYSGRVAADPRMYYNKGFSDLKKVNYRNLMRDMADHPESMDLLKSYRKSINNSNIMYTAAGASILAALVTFVAQGTGGSRRSTSGSGFESSQSGQRNFESSIRPANFTASFVLLGAGVGFAIGGYSMTIAGQRHLEQAVEVYNR